MGETIRVQDAGGCCYCPFYKPEPVAACECCGPDYVCAADPKERGVVGSRPVWCPLHQGDVTVTIEMGS